jgi:hypothetical protein
MPLNEVYTHQDSLPRLFDLQNFNVFKGLDLWAALALRRLFPGEGIGSE